MTDSSRQIVRQGLDHAHASALPVLHARLAHHSPEVQALASKCAEGILTCLRDLSESPGPNQAIQDALMRLIFSHADRELVAALREFAEVMNFYLMEARDRTRSAPERRDS